MRYVIAALAFLAACGSGSSNPNPIPVGPPYPQDECTPEYAGFGGAPTVEFSHYVPPLHCTLDQVGRDATCNVSGCTAPNIQTWFEREEEMAPYLSCEPGVSASTGIDFSQRHVLFVRQGMRTGEWMKREPVVWVVEAEGKVIVAEKRRAFCITGSDINGGVVSYGLLLPASTASTSVDRRVYRNPNGCDMCSGEGDCSG